MNELIGKTITFYKTYEYETFTGDIDVYSFIKTSDGCIYITIIYGENADDSIINYSSISKEDYDSLVIKLENYNPQRDTSLFYDL